MMNKRSNRKRVKINDMMNENLNTKTEEKQLDSPKQEILDKYDIKVMGTSTEIINGVEEPVYIMSKSNFRFNAFADGTPTPRGAKDLSPLGGDPKVIHTDKHIMNMTLETLKEKDLMQRVEQTLLVVSYIMDNDSFEQMKLDLSMMTEEQKGNKTHMLAITDDMIYGDAIPYAKYSSDIENEEYLSILRNKKGIPELLDELGHNDIIRGIKEEYQEREVPVIDVNEDDKIVKQIPSIKEVEETVEEPQELITRETPVVNKNVKINRKSTITKKTKKNSAIKNKLSAFRKIVSTSNIQSEYVIGYAPYSGIKYRIKPINTITKGRALYENFGRLSRFNNMQGIVEVLQDAFAEMELLVSDNDRFNLLEDGFDLFHYKDIKYILISAIQASGISELKGITYGCNICGNNNIKSKPIELSKLAFDLDEEQMKRLSNYDANKTLDEVTKGSLVNQDIVEHQTTFDFEKGDMDEDNLLNVNRSVVSINTSQPTIKRHITMRSLGWASIKMAVIVALSSDNLATREEIIVAVSKMSNDEIYELAIQKCNDYITNMEANMTLMYSIENVHVSLCTRDLIKGSQTDYSVKEIDSYSMELIEDIFEIEGEQIGDPYTPMMSFLNSLTPEQEQFLMNQAVMPEEESSIVLRTFCGKCGKPIDITMGIPLVGFMIYREMYMLKTSSGTNNNE